MRMIEKRRFQFFFFVLVIALQHGVAYSESVADSNRDSYACSRGSHWEQISHKRMHSISVGDDGSVWATDGSNYYVWRDGFHKMEVVDSYGHRPIHISSARVGYTFLIDSDYRLYYLLGSTLVDPLWYALEPFRHRFHDVSVSSDYQIWALSYRERGDGSVRTGIRYRLGVSSHNPMGEEWKQIDGGLTQISVGNMHQVWGVNSFKDGLLVRRVGASYDKPYGSKWEHIAYGFSHVSAGADGAVWAVTMDGVPSKLYGRQFVYNRNVRLRSIAVASADRVFGLTPDGHVMRCLNDANY